MPSFVFLICLFLEAYEALHGHSLGIFFFLAHHVWARYQESQSTKHAKPTPGRLWTGGRCPSVYPVPALWLPW